MKCLEKDRTRRYETANGLAADLRRFLNSEPVIARPPTGFYRLKKTIRRNRGRFAATLSIIAALLIGIGANPLLRRHVHPKAIEEAVASLPKRGAETPPNLIDLSALYNVSLEGSAGWQLSASSGHTIQRGPQRLGEVLFDVRGAIRLNSPNPGFGELPFPERVEGIVVSRKCRRLHFLHFVFSSERPGVKVATYRIRYHDRQTWDIPVKYGENVRTWSASVWGTADPLFELENTNSVVAWVGTNIALSSARLFRTSVDNPRPDAEIKTIDFISNMKDSSPVLVAITVEP